MKKLFLIIITLILINIMPCHASAEEASLIEDTQISLKSTETPTRLLISFILAEPIDLSQENTDIIIEFFSMNDSGNLEAIRYKKDKSWSGYLNSYDNYPAGERKYSSGNDNGQYSNQVPATRIYTSTKTNASIDVTTVAAVKITVLRSDGSGEIVSVYSDGTMYDVEEIVADIPDDNKSIGIIMESVTSELPEDTVLVANEVTSGSIYEKAVLLLADVKHFVALDITLESGGAKIQPDGKVRISIPIPEHFSGSNLAVYRIDDNGSKSLYPVTITNRDEIQYATFDADHFSVYILAELIKTETEIENKTYTRTNERTGATTGETAKYETVLELEENEIPLKYTNPQTGAIKTFSCYIAIVLIIISATTLLFVNRQKV